MSQLTYLIDEICAGLEIYYTGRQGGQYLKTAFILCDDYTELTSKLYLLTDNPNWSETKANGHWKNYRDIQQDVVDVITGKRPTELANLQALHNNMKIRRDRRNDFFHSTHLLDLSVMSRNCVDAFCDLLDYGRVLFGRDWTDEVTSRRSLEILQLLLILEKKNFNDPSIWPKVNNLLRSWPCNTSSRSARGAYITVHPEDLHLRLCVRDGGMELRDKLAVLL